MPAQEENNSISTICKTENTAFSAEVNATDLWFLLIRIGK
jgi:hypothetical protein